MTTISKIYHTFGSVFPPSKLYRELYKRYISTDKLNRFLDLISNYKNCSVADLCCGNGRAGLEAINRGAKEVVFVDKSYDMFELHGRYEFINSDIHSYFLIAERQFDIAICQESINYWFDEKSALLLSKIIKPNGYFIFNTFDMFDKNQIVVSNYKIDNKHYVEFVHRNDSDIMTHVQICDDITHVHSFNYLEKQFLINQLQEFFTVDYKKENNTLLFVCRKK